MPRKKLSESENITATNEVTEEKKQTVENATVEESVSEEATIENSPEENENIFDEEEDVKNETQVNEERRMLDLGVLKIHLDDEEQEDDKFEVLWNELATYYRTRRIVPVVVTGIERTQLAGSVLVAYYKEQRILVPLTEMMINLSEEKGEGYTINERLDRVCNTMLGAEIDVMIKGMDKKNASIVASRKGAMLKKREKFYLTPLSDGLPQMREGRIVEARIVGVTNLVARLEIFGVETTLGVKELSWDWLPNVSDKFHVGEKLNVLIKEIKGDNVNNLKVYVDLKSITKNVSVENLSKCVSQNKYIGEVTNVRNGVTYVRLKIGVNAIVSANYDRRTPGKGDIVSFVITRVNPEFGNVTGIISKIIKQSI